jgi:zinc/manganese transport system substrate-binding protein
MLNCTHGMARRWRVAVVALALLQISGASSLHADLSVVATTADYGALATAIGGDKVSLDVLAKPTEDPHFVDAKPSHVVKLNRADVLIESGAGLELGWLPPLVAGSRNKHLLPGAPGLVLASTGIALLDVPATLDRSQGDIHAQGNPHFMMDPANAGIVARHLTDTFCRLDSASCPTYKENLARFEQRLQQKSRDWEAKLAPYRGTQVVTYHTTWRYFAKRFGLQADLFLEPKPGIPPSPPQLASVIQQMKEQGLKLILVEPFQSRKTAAVVADHTGGRVVDVCQFPGGLPGTDNDYFALMDADVGAIADALSATVAP